MIMITLLIHNNLYISILY